MNYIDLLTSSAKKYSSIVCMGLDPVIEDIPIECTSVKSKIVSFYTEILNEIIHTNIYPSAVKPNYAFYAQYGFEGLEALYDIISLYREAGIPVILDAKRGDIDKTAAAYAKECFGFFQADAVTIAPYMGADSVTPFTTLYPDKGYYVLNKTSNKSSVEIQNISIDGVPIYLHVSRLILKWYAPGIGAVVGATFIREMEEILDVFTSSEKEIPLLIPGIGAQGGNLEEVMTILSKTPSAYIHRINSSGAINYAYKKNGLPFEKAAVIALKDLNDSIECFL